ncbi:hypothetical protein Anapl_00002 [Anas platyrhynchos]|uniref:Uncharacterized protein n=1 Tax=Anas platyrhynchos TaxID=8839 RepID=R0LDP8_ANAPL|nr:hypothetical protein Anapl_00002 [Anas platyrhynchos]
MVSNQAAAAQWIFEQIGGEKELEFIYPTPGAEGDQRGGCCLSQTLLPFLKSLLWQPGLPQGCWLQLALHFKATQVWEASIPSNAATYSQPRKGTAHTATGLIAHIDSITEHADVQEDYLHSIFPEKLKWYNASSPVEEEEKITSPVEEEEKNTIKCFRDNSSLHKNNQKTETKEVGTLRRSWGMGNMLRGGLNDAEAEGNVSGWEDTEVVGLRNTGIQDTDWGPPALAIPSLANPAQNDDRAVLTTLPLSYFQRLIPNPAATGEGGGVALAFSSPLVTPELVFQGHTSGDARRPAANSVLLHITYRKSPPPSFRAALGVFSRVIEEAGKIHTSTRFDLMKFPLENQNQPNSSWLMGGAEQIIAVCGMLKHGLPQKHLSPLPNHQGLQAQNHTALGLFGLAPNRRAKANSEEAGAVGSSSRALKEQGQRPNLLVPLSWSAMLLVPTALWDPPVPRRAGSELPRVNVPLLLLEHSLPRPGRAPEPNNCGSNPTEQAAAPPDPAQPRGELGDVPVPKAAPRRREQPDILSCSAIKLQLFQGDCIVESSEESQPENCKASLTSSLLNPGSESGSRLSSLLLPTALLGSAAAWGGTDLQERCAATPAASASPGGILHTTTGCLRLPRISGVFCRASGPRWSRLSPHLDARGDKPQQHPLALTKPVRGYRANWEQHRTGQLPHLGVTASSVTLGFSDPLLPAGPQALVFHIPAECL